MMTFSTTTGTVRKSSYHQEVHILDFNHLKTIVQFVFPSLKSTQIIFMLDTPQERRFVLKKCRENVFQISRFSFLNPLYADCILFLPPGIRN